MAFTMLTTVSVYEEKKCLAAKSGKDRTKDTFSGQFSDYMEHSPKHARRLSHRYVS